MLHSKFRPTLLAASIAAVAGTCVFLSSCNNNSSSSTPSAQTVTKEVSVPSTDAEQTKITTVNRLTLNGKEYTVDFSTILKTGYADNGEVFGALKDENGNVITHADGSTVICNGTSNSPTVEGAGLDHTTIIEQNGKIHLVGTFECQTGAMYTAELQQSSDGVLSPVANTLKFIDQSAYKGGWVHCAGMRTPWNSLLSGEEYEPDGRSVEAVESAANQALPANDPNKKDYDKYYASAVHFFGEDFTKLNPYFYGWTPEVSFDATDQPVYIKHYTLGRAGSELSYVMPDQKTVYKTEDGANNGFYRFVADTAGDLSAGTLYAAKWTQTDSQGAGTADISWISLGHATDAEVKALALSGLKFSDILDSADPVDENTGTCPAGFTFVNTGTGRECLAFKDINADGLVDAKDEVLAGRLESRRVAAMKGATTEFRKFEGFTFNDRDNKAYVAMSAIERGMENGFSIPKDSDKYDRGGNNDIKLAYNKCGAVYELAVDANYVVTSMTSILEGFPLAVKDEVGNSCHADYVSNPDNVTYLPGTDTLLVGEDTSKHTNNMVWSYNIDDKSITRIATVQLDAETTSPYWHTVGNFGYIGLVSQHPMEDQTTDQSNKEDVFGVIGPFPLPLQ